MGFGISMPYAYLSEKELYEALKKVLQDPKYLENAQKYGSMLSDQITKPLDRVNYLKTTGILFWKLFWPAVKKNVLVIEKQNWEY